MSASHPSRRQVETLREALQLASLSWTEQFGTVVRIAVLGSDMMLCTLTLLHYVTHLTQYAADHA